MFCIFDSFRDKIYCLEGKDAYNFIIDDTLARQGRNFGHADHFSFDSKVCANDNDYDDNQIGTEDVCIVETSACLHYNKECNEYGKETKTWLDAQCDLAFDASTIVDKNGITQVKGGPHLEPHDTCNHSETCFANDVYAVYYSGKGHVHMTIKVGDTLVLDYLLSSFDQETTFNTEWISV